MRFYRTPAMAADGDDSIGFVINRGRTAVASQRGREVELRRGDAVPILSQEPAILTSVHHSGVILPRAALASRLSNIDYAGMRVVPRRTEAMRLLSNYVSMVHDGSALAIPELRDMLVSHLPIWSRWRGWRRGREKFPEILSIAISESYQAATSRNP